MSATSRFVMVLGVVVISAAAVVGAGQAPARRPAEPAVATATGQLGNADVIKLVQSGLSEGFVVARIRQAPATNFDLSADALVALKKAGVTEAVLAVMLDPASKPSPAPPASALASSASVAAAPPAETATREPGIYLGDLGANQIPLEPTVFSQGKSGGGLASAFTYGLVKASGRRSSGTRHFS